MKPGPKPVYLDHNASTPVLPEVLDAMLPWLRDHFGNPSSAHVYGRTMHRAIGQAREQVASLLDCEPGEVFFTSGGTESNNLAIRGLAKAYPQRRHLVTSVAEHPATSGPCAYLERKGYTVDRIAVDRFGHIDVRAAGDALRKRPLLISIMHANSETGTIQPVAETAEEAHENQAFMHVDAAQTAGKIPLSVRKEGIDLLSLAGHKLYAPQGVGALYIRQGVRIEPLVIGAGHENGVRPGTENVAAIAGLGKACEIAARDLAAEARRQTELRDLLWERLRSRVPGLALNGHPVNRLPNTLNVRFPDISGSALLAACTAAAASTGSACHEASETASAVIVAMGVPADQALGSIRFSLGRGTTREEIEFVADALARCWQGLA